MLLLLFVINLMGVVIVVGIVFYFVSFILVVI